MEVDWLGWSSLVATFDVTSHHYKECSEPYTELDRIFNQSAMEKKSEKWAKGLIPVPVLAGFTSQNAGWI